MNELVSGTGFDALLEHSAWVRRLAGCLVRDDAQADDLTQEAWLVALRHPPTEGLPARPWLAQVVRNLLRMRVRGDRRRRAREEATQADAAVREPPLDSPDQLVARAEAQQLLAGLVVALAEPYRSTVLLRYYEGLSAADIAARQSVPAGTVRWRLKTGLDQLRAELDRSRGGDRRAWQLAMVPLGAWPMEPINTGPLAGATASKGALLMKPLLLAVVVVASVTGGLVATRTKAAPPSAQKSVRSAALKPARAALPPAKALPPLDKEQRARLLQRISESHHKPASVPGGATTDASELDKEYIRAQMITLLPLIKECYENTLTTQPDVGGKLVVDFTIIAEPDIGGMVSDSSINVAGSTILDPAMRECVKETMYAAQFPAPEGGGEVHVTYPFVFASDK